MLDTLNRFERWVGRGLCIIRDKHANLVPLRFNRTQRRLLAAAKEQAAKDQPIRQVILKARKHGVTTFWQAFAFFLCGYESNHVAVFLAHREDDTKLIFDVIKRIAANHPIVRVKGNEPMRFLDSGGLYWAMTAGGSNVAAGGTPTYLHLSEVALYKLNKADTLTSSTQAVPRTPNTVIIQESTARGREEFWETFDAASDPLHPYEPLFFPWYYDDDSSIETEPLLDITEDEEWLVQHALAHDGIVLTHGHLAWRREKILEIGPYVFLQEYPATPEEAVQGRSDLVLPRLRDCIIDELPFDYANIVWDDRSGGLDWGFHDPTVILSSVYRDQVLYVLDVWRASGKLAGDHVEGLLEGHTYFCDPSAVGPVAEIRNEARKLGIPAYLKPAPRGKGSREVDFVEAEWETVRKLRSEDRLKILRSCSDQLILEADNLAYNIRTGKPDTSRGATWGHFDTLDALRYNSIGCTRYSHRSAETARQARSVSRKESIRQF